MPEGNRRIVLQEPAPTGETGPFGGVKQGPPIPHVVWAVRNDKPSAGEGMLAAGVEGGAWRTEYTIRAETVSKRPTEDWSVVDESGQELRLEGVFEVNSGSRARRLVLVCERTST